MSPTQYRSARESDDLKPRMSGPSKGSLTIEATALITLFLVLVTEFSEWHRRRRLSATARIIVLAILLGTPCAAVLGTEICYQTQSGVSLGQALCHFALLRLRSAVPNGLAAGILGIARVAVIYLIVSRQFVQTKVSGRSRIEER